MKKAAFAALILFTLLTPVVSFAAVNVGGTPLVPQAGTGGTRPSDYNLCDLRTEANNFIAFGIGLSTIVATLMFAYGGILYVTNPANPENIKKATKVVTNALVGIVIVLLAWLIVNILLSVMTGQGVQSWVGWVNACDPNPVGAAFSPAQAPGTMTGGDQGQLLPNGTGACDPNAVQAAATAGGYNISTAEAKTLACIARPESACGRNTTGATTPGGTPTSAAGPFQILLGSPDKCHSLNIPACGNLQCSNAYSGGKVKSDPASQALAQKCIAAANNLQCSTSAAACLVEQNHGSYGAWMADSRSSAQAQCVANYSH